MKMQNSHSKQLIQAISGDSNKEERKMDVILGLNLRLKIAKELKKQYFSGTFKYFLFFEANKEKIKKGGFFTYIF